MTSPIIPNDRRVASIVSIAAEDGGVTLPMSADVDYLQWGLANPLADESITCATEAELPVVRRWGAAVLYEIYDSVEGDEAFRPRMLNGELSCLKALSPKAQQDTLGTVLRWAAREPGTSVKRIAYGLYILTAKEEAA